MTITNIIFFLAYIIQWLILLYLLYSLIRFNPLSRGLEIIRTILVLMFIFILGYNMFQHILFIMNLLIPLSIDKITYLDEFKDSEIKFLKSESYILYNLNVEDNIEAISDFLNQLDDDKNYVANLEYIPNVWDYEENPPILFISPSITINKLSSPSIISFFIDNRLKLMEEFYKFDFILNYSNKGVRIRYNKIIIN